MNHVTIGFILIALGITYFCAGYFKIRVWIFGLGENAVLAKAGEEKVFKTRKIKGIFGILFGIFVIFYGKF